MFGPTFSRGLVSMLGETKLTNSFLSFGEMTAKVGLNRSPGPAWPPGPICPPLTEGIKAGD